MKYLILTLVSVTSLLFTGCETTARQSGEDAGLVAVIAFDSPSDIEVLERAKTRIDKFLESGEPITDSLVSTFAEWLASELGKNPAAVRLAVSRLQRWVLKPGEILEPGQLDPAREFVAGLSDSLGIAFD